MRPVAFVVLGFCLFTARSSAQLPVLSASALLEAPAGADYFGSDICGSANCGSASAGFEHSAVATPDGALWAWGSNAGGILGVGSEPRELKPSAVLDLESVYQVALGRAHGLALRTDGSVFAWGRNERGQLGTGGADAETPVRIAGLADIVAIAAGEEHSLALTATGAVLAWGSGSSGQLGDGTDAPRETPAEVPKLTDVVAIAAGARHSLALRHDGTIWSWGANERGQLGEGGTENRWSPIPVRSLAGIVAITSGPSAQHSLAIDGNRRLWAWGDNSDGQLGDGSGVDQPTPVPVGGFAAGAQVAAGAHHTVAIARDGTLWAWGDNTSGQLGSSGVSKPFPVRVDGIASAVRVAAGELHSLAITADGVVYAWGGNSEGQVGDGTRDRALTPSALSASSFRWKARSLVPPSTPSDAEPKELQQRTLLLAAKVHLDTPIGNVDGIVTGAGWAYRCEGSITSRELLVDGVVMATATFTPGMNRPDVQAGEQAECPSVPLDVGFTFTFDSRTLSFGTHTIEIRVLDDLSATTLSNEQTINVQPIVRLWLDGLSGQARGSAIGGWGWAFRCDAPLTTYEVLLDGTPDPFTTFNLGSSRPDVQAAYLDICPGLPDTVGLGYQIDTSRLALGDHQMRIRVTDGLGNSYTSNATALTVGGFIAAGSDHSLAVTQVGHPWSWGRNADGQLGNGGTSDQTSPVPVAGLTDLWSVTAGEAHSFGVQQMDGLVFAWGRNDRGQLGDGTTQPRTEPVLVPGLEWPYELVAGGRHNLARYEGVGVVSTWGANDFGQIGNGGSADILSPTPITTPGAVITMTAGRDHSVAVLAGGTVWS